ncbi:MAG: hypothetical protein A3J76_01000 [Candidatus Moranbacteria bacterium RBG_13_45_13]|nr:MAG: hypothetical protein A3J76_01000 [Candidatus Moranbacteria bacterium RBG_13_45_13]
MKSLERRFNNIAERNPFWSSHICFAEAVKGQKFSRQIIHRWFQKLVDKDDYARSDKRAVLAHLENLTSLLRTTEIKGKATRQQA